MFCRNCGLELSEDSKFCSRCGCKVEVETPVVNTEKAEVEISTVNIEKAEGAKTQEDVAVNEEVAVSPKRFEKLHRKHSNRFFLIGFILAAIGVVMFFGLLLYDLIIRGEIKLYGGYVLNETLTTVSLVGMLLGFLALGWTCIADRKFKAVRLLTKKKFVILSIVLIVFCVGFSAWGLVDCIDDRNNGGYYYDDWDDYDYDDYYNDYYSSGIDKSIGLSIKVDSIKTSGSYTYVYCSVKNVSSSYVATKYRYVKVKAQFKNYSGTIVDTDWTYAIDSTWLEPGETKTFYYMVKNTNIKSATLSFVD